MVGFLLALTMLAAACAGTTRHPVSESPVTHSGQPRTVVSGHSPPTSAAQPRTAFGAHSRPTSTAHATAAATPAAPGSRGFALVVKTDTGDLPARVAPLSVASHQLVDPPHNTAQQWDTAAWIVQAAYPAAESTGTTYIYGHACHHHICPFTNLKQAAGGDPVIVTTPTARLTYLIRRIGLSPKSANSLPGWASDSTVKNRLVLVTCEFEDGDTSTNNIVMVAELSSATPAHSQP